MLASVALRTALDLAGLLGAILIVLASLHFTVHSAAVEALIIDQVTPALALPLEILRHVAEHSLDSGSIWLNCSVLALIFVGAAIDFALGNFCRQLATVLGVRLDAIEALNPDWDAAVAKAGSLGSAGGATPHINLQFQDGGAAAASPSVQQQQLPAQDTRPEFGGRYAAPVTRVKGRK